MMQQAVPPLTFSPSLSANQVRKTVHALPLVQGFEMVGLWDSKDGLPIFDSAARGVECPGHLHISFAATSNPKLKVP